MKEKENVIRILRETNQAIGSADVIKLKDLSNQTIHTASVTQDPDNIAIAVKVYSLGKIVERRYLRDGKVITKIINDLIFAIGKDDEKDIRKNLELIRTNLEKNSQLREYIEDVFKKAQINKASKIYEHGISLEKTSKLLGVSMFDLASYAGQSVREDSEEKTINVKSRIKTAMEMFEK
jgi:hypothetical protein